MTTVKSADAQKSFGQIIEQAHGDEVVVVERYGRPRVVIVDFARYQELIQGEREHLRSRLRQASEAASARAAELSDGEVDRLIEEARSEAHQRRSTA
jgi:prevent-host-death family protein